MHDTRRTRLVLAVLLAAALALITVDYRDGTASPLHSLSSFGGSVFGSAEGAVSLLTSPVRQLAGGSGSQAKIASLQRQLAQARAELSQERLSRAQSAQLDGLLRLAGRGGYRIVAANLIAAGPAYADTITIDAGRMDGIKANETVLNGAGLVGTVTAVSAGTATVLLTTDASATVGVRLAGTGLIGAVTGTGKSISSAGLLRLEVFSSSAQLRPGQQLVTFGSADGMPYVAGVPVGVITQVEEAGSSLMRQALVRPFVSVASIGVVGVVVAPPRTNPRDSVLPPPPAPAPTVTVTATATPSSTATANPASTATPKPGG
ncbi:MAG: rod shape-determining protein MreC [Streptosporangiaceae bacterium]|nr:rod shape-determining protein MreC [Streptosporangiaceae bacterium]